MFILFNFKKIIYQHASKFIQYDVKLPTGATIKIMLRIRRLRRREEEEQKEEEEDVKRNVFIKPRVSELTYTRHSFQWRTGYRENENRREGRVQKTSGKTRRLVARVGSPLTASKGSPSKR